VVHTADASHSKEDRRVENAPGEVAGVDKNDQDSGSRMRRQSYRSTRLPLQLRLRALARIPIHRGVMEVIEMVVSTLRTLHDYFDGWMRSRKFFAQMKCERLCAAETEREERHQLGFADLLAPQHVLLVPRATSREHGTRTRRSPTTTALPNHINLAQGNTMKRDPVRRHSDQAMAAPTPSPAPSRCRGHR
jgi:hypothetical protein